jgi:hypothetical protein
MSRELLGPVFTFGRDNVTGDCHGFYSFAWHHGPHSQSNAA